MAGSLVVRKEAVTGQGTDEPEGDTEGQNAWNLGICLCVLIRVPIAGKKKITTTTIIIEINQRQHEEERVYYILQRIAHCPEK